VRRLLGHPRSYAPTERARLSLLVRRRAGKVCSFHSMGLNRYCKWASGTISKISAAVRALRLSAFVTISQAYQASSEAPSRNTRRGIKCSMMSSLSSVIRIVMLPYDASRTLSSKCASSEATSPSRVNLDSDSARLMVCRRGSTLELLLDVCDLAGGLNAFSNQTTASQIVQFLSLECIRGEL
jgi:hypothetical protein